MSSDLTITDKQDGFTDNQIAALQQMGAQDASQGDLAVFFHEVQRTGLDPFARQIYMIGRRTKVGDRWVTKCTIQTGIDGFRLIARRAADRSHEAFSELVTAWCGPDAAWWEAWLDSTHPLLAAKVVVQRGRGTFTGAATLEEYQGLRKAKGPGRLMACRADLYVEEQAGRQARQMRGGPDPAQGFRAGPVGPVQRRRDTGERFEGGPAAV